MTADKQILAARIAGETIELLSPSPGMFHAQVALGDVVRAGGVLGDLEILGKTHELVAPDTAHGVVIWRRDPALARTSVDFGAVLLALDPRASAAGLATAAVATSTTAVAGLVFRAPTSGRFYGRAAADKPPFVTAGAELTAGATVCLLEVMKTFHRVSYGGPGMPDPVRVREVLVADGADVTAGEPLLALEAV